MPSRVLPSAVFALLVALVAMPAQGVTCRSWNRMSIEQREAQISRMIGEVVSSHVAQQYNVSKTRVAKCLDRSAYRIQDDFDDACADQRTAGMRALDNIFNRYIWSCVR